MPSERRELNRIVVHQWHCDYFGHLNVRNYAAIFDDAILLFWSANGLKASDTIVPVTAETRTSFRSEALVGTIAVVRAETIRVGTKSAAVRLEMEDAESGRSIATCEVVDVFFNLQTRESEPIPPAIRANLST